MAERAERAERTPWWGVVSSTAAPVLLIGGWTWAAARQEIDFDSLTQTISALAALDATDRWVMTAALTGVGLSHITTALALRSAALPGRLVLAGGGLATMLVAALPLPTVVGDGGSTPHTIVAGISFGALAVWPAFAARSSRAPSLAVMAKTTKDPGGARRTRGGDKPAVPWALRRKVALAATAVLLAGVAWFVSDLGDDVSQVGLSERVTAGAQAIWPLLVVLSTRRALRRS
ncbi:MAG: DUF998 domain-containing protein [Geodermatophilaceae bacterium]|nr:DUF998 domain-containing protein [Geodermatophilaceae bacterium]